jgi:hypothetical protein
MTTFAPTFWFAILPLMLLGGALVGVGAFKGWAISSFVIFGLGVMPMVVWVVTLPA